MANIDTVNSSSNATTLYPIIFEKAKQTEEIRITDAELIKNCSAELYLIVLFLLSNTSIKIKSKARNIKIL